MGTEGRVVHFSRGDVGARKKLQKAAWSREIQWHVCQGDRSGGARNEGGHLTSQSVMSSGK